MQSKITAEELQRDAASILARARAGERVVVTDGADDVAVLLSAAEYQALRHADSVQGVVAKARAAARRLDHDDYVSWERLKEGE